MQRQAMDVLLTESEVAEHLRVSVALVRRWRWLGEGPQFIRVGKAAVRYRREDVEQYLANRPTGGGTVQVASQARSVEARA